MRELGCRHAKIVCTLGPATDSPGALEALVGAGMDVARVNLSHGAPEEHARRIRQVRELSRKLGRSFGIVADLPGPKYRLGSLRGGSIVLKDGARVHLAQSANGPYVLPLSQPGLLAALRPGDPVYLADGMIRLVVEGSAGGG